MPHGLVFGEIDPLPSTRMLAGTGNAFEDPTEQQVRLWAKAFETASPFPHLVVDDFLEDADGLREEFPDLDWPGWSEMVEVYQPGKRYLLRHRRHPAEAARDDHPTEQPTDPANPRDASPGVKRLLSDPYLDGAGLHASGPGGVLLPHSDFHFHNHGIFRRLNLLVYLNEEWGEEDGGSLEFYGDAEAKTEPDRVIPIQGRAVLFATNERSVHGFTATGRRRQVPAVDRALLLHVDRAPRSTAVIGPPCGATTVTTKAGWPTRGSRCSVGS